MTPTDEGRTQHCTPADARVRLQHAKKFLEVAQLIAEPEQDREYVSAATALAVLAGIAAADAACCHTLHRRSRGQNHRQAADLVEQIVPGGPEASKSLGRLLNLKDQAHYGLFDISGRDFDAALRQAQALVTFAATVLRQ